MPRGAEAALWSILEVTPDPRNHLALTQDLSGEVRVTDLDRARALAAARAHRPSGAEPRPNPSAEVELVLVDTVERAHDVRDEHDDLVDDRYDLGTLAENRSLTDHLFSGAES